MNNIKIIDTITYTVTMETKTSFWTKIFRFLRLKKKMVVFPLTLSLDSPIFENGTILSTGNVNLKIIKQNRKL